MFANNLSSLLKISPKKEVTHCLKMIEKVAFIIASEASYVYILSGQKFIKKAKIGQFGVFLKNCSLRSNSVTRYVNFNRTKIDEKFKCDIFGDFQTMCSRSN